MKAIDKSMFFIFSWADNGNNPRYVNVQIN